MSALLDWAVALSGPVGVAIGVAGKSWFDRSVTVATVKRTEAEDTKIDAEAAQIIANTAVMLVAPLQGQITELTGRVGTLEMENTATKTRLQSAIDHIRQLRLFINKHIPDKTPPQPPSGLGL